MAITDKVIDLAGDMKRIPALALQLILIGILLPTALYSFNLHNPTPAQLLVAICMALFSGVVFLWILDATSILRFRSVWVSRSVYTAAIVSVLGTSVAVYQDSFGGKKYVYEGAWDVATASANGASPIVDHKLVLSYSESAGAYWGYSNVTLPAVGPSGANNTAVWLEVRQFRPEDRQIFMRLVFGDGSSRLISQQLVIAANRRRFDTQDEKFKLSFTRPTI